MAAKDMVRSKFPWIYFLHCVAHEGSLIVKDICKIEEVGTCMCIMCIPIYISVHVCTSCVIALVCVLHTGCRVDDVDDGRAEMVYHRQGGTSVESVL